MYLSRILISNFKNIRSADLAFSKKINCICGNNGEGKTNLLDAIYYLSMTKSYFHASDAFTFTFGESSAALNGTYVREDGTEDKISLRVVSPNDKTVKRNGKAYTRLSEHIGVIPIVMVSPSDTGLIREGGDERRKFMNSLLSQVDKEYLKRIQQYNQLLAQRNKLLKMPPVCMELLDTLNEQMDAHADYIYYKRKILCEELSSLAREYYGALSGSKEEISLRYVSDLDQVPLTELFARAIERDLFLKYTTVGIQKDDVEFSMNGYPIKKCGSQGQQKSFLIALKLAQFRLMKQMHGVTPVLLLDDVFDKLDMQRVEYLLELVAGDAFGQIFISDSNKVRMGRILDAVLNDHKSFTVERGVFTEQ